MLTKKIFGVFGILIVSLLLVNVVSAGVGLKWDRESQIVNQGEKTCFSYSVYNPWSKDSYAKIEVSPELREIIKSQETEAKLIPANTPSSSAIPLEFCFSVPYVYQETRECLVGSMLCEQKCGQEQKTYSGEVLVSEAGGIGAVSGAGGSTTSITVSAPLKIKVACIEKGRDYKPVYLLIMVVSFVVICLLVARKYQKPKMERYKEEMKKLSEKIKKEKKQKK